MRSRASTLNFGTLLQRAHSSHSFEPRKCSPRHWTELKRLLGKDFVSPDQDANIVLGEILELNLYACIEDVEEIGNQAIKEGQMERDLERLHTFWSGKSDGAPGVVFVEEMVESATLSISDDDAEALESDIQLVQTMASSRYAMYFLEKYTDREGESKHGMNYWKRSLKMIADVTCILSDAQRMWAYLEPLFMKSDEVKQALAEDAKRFTKVDVEVRMVLKESKEVKTCLRA